MLFIFILICVMIYGQLTTRTKPTFYAFIFIFSLCIVIIIIISFLANNLCNEFVNFFCVRLPILKLQRT